MSASGKSERQPRKGPRSMQLSANAPRTVYIHIPFCTNKCYYCDFNSYVLKGQPVMDYLRALEREMELTAEKIPPSEIDTIFVGGGTPTVLTPEQMNYFLQTVRTYFPQRSETIEFTMEANPGTTDLEKLQAMKEGGVNRVSFGVQSFDNRLLAEIGRIHDTDDVYASIENAKKAGFSNLSIDLMFGLPEQTPETLEHSVNETLKLGLQHYSIYALKVEENTLFHQLYKNGRLPLPDEDAEVEMFELIIRKLGGAGYRQYEISNFAKPGYESRHNTAYWKNKSYYGMGAGAHGYINRTRHMNIKGVNEYIAACQKGLPMLETTIVSEKEAMEDFMMVGLRMLAGVGKADFSEQFHADMDEVFAEPLQRLQRQALLEATDDGYRLSERGLFLGNEVFAAFLS